MQAEAAEEMNDKGFEPGDIVSLKSGGPWMTVERVGPEGGLVCAWFVAGGNLLRTTFFAPMLDPYRGEVKLASVTPIHKGTDS